MNLIFNKTLVVWLLLTVLAATPMSVIAQQATLAEDINGVRTFTPEDFARFAPRTALDMVQQIPGFTISEADERRGLGQATENVLLNGKRISGKTNDAITALGRIPADNVIRIEILEGATLDIPGLSGQVVNIVSANTGGISGRYVWRPEFRFENNVPARLTAGEASVSGAFNKFDYTVSVENDSFRSANSGLEQVFDPVNNVIDERDEITRFRGENPVFSVALDYSGDNGNVGNLDLAYGIFDFRRSELSLQSGANQPDRVRDFMNSEDEWNFEGSGDYEFGLGGGRLKVIGFQRFEHSPTLNALRTEFADDSPDTGSRFDRVADEGESIFRAEYYWKTSSGSDWQLSTEGAYNFLDIESELEVLDDNGEFILVDIPGATSRVEELRGEVAATYATPLSSNWSLQTSLGAEYSEISQSGELGQTRSFVRPKGFAALNWQPGENTDVTFRIEREVGQLNFFDFVASVNVDLNNQNESNPDLVPQQSWIGEVVLVQKFGEYGSTNLRVFGELITDITDQIPIGPDGEAPGNIDSATVYGLELNSTLLLDPLGWRGARLDVNLELQGSSVDDPLTGLARRISRSPIRELEIEFRHDIPTTDWAYGAMYFERRQSSVVRLSETRLFISRPGDLGVFLEHKDVFGLTVNAALLNLLDSEERFTRTSFVNRNNGPVAFREERVRTFGPILNFTISGAF